jgi:HTH-type transcriptional regulator, competence development regulator
MTDGQKEPWVRFGGRLRTLRSAKGIGLRELARQVGMSPTYLSKIETGQAAPPVEEKVFKLAEVLEENQDDLLALAGRVAADLQDIIRSRPSAMADLLLVASDLSDEKLGELIRWGKRRRPRQRQGE